MFFVYSFFTFEHLKKILTNTAIFPHIGDHTMKQFFLNLYFCYLFKTKMPRNMRKLRVKLRNGNIYPLEVHISCTSDPSFQIKCLLIILDI